MLSRLTKLQRWWASINLIVLYQSMPPFVFPHSDKKKIYVQASCALTGDGLYEGLDWLQAQLKGRLQVNKKDSSSNNNNNGNNDSSSKSSNKTNTNSESNNSNNNNKADIVKVICNFWYTILSLPQLLGSSTPTTSIHLRKWPTFQWRIFTKIWRLHTSLLGP